MKGDIVPGDSSIVVSLNKRQKRTYMGFGVLVIRGAFEGI